MVWLILIGLLCLQASAEDIDLVTVFPACDEGAAPCEDINSALQGLRSNTTLALLEGEHTVRNVSMVVDVFDIKIVGNRSDPSLIRIACDSGVGLVFSNVTNLELSGFTIENCGLSDSYNNSIETFSDFNRRYIRPIIIFRPNTSVALLIGDCCNLIMENVTLQNNVGFGMVGKNIVGNSSLSGLQVLSNYPNICNISLSNTDGTGSGGGILLSYEDYKDTVNNNFVFNTTLVIENSVFADNYICTANVFTTQYNLLSRSISTIDLIQGNYTIDGSGGLTIIGSHSEYRINATVKSCTFRNNSGVWTGSALNIVQFESTDNSHIIIDDCDFDDNGGGLKDRYGVLDYFGALLAVMYLPFPSELITPQTAADFIQHDTSTIAVTNCRFRNNLALSGAATAVFSFGPTVGFVQDEMYFQKCEFYNNTAAYGPAIFVTEISYSAFEPGLEVFFEDMVIVNNSRGDESGNFQSQTGAVDVNYLNVHFNGSNHFLNNLVTALHAYSGIISMSGDCVFYNNTGVNGGALHLDTESYIILQQTANVRFMDNTGLLSGGAIFVNFQTVRNTAYDCFLFFEKIDVFCNLLGNCSVPSNGKIRMVFVGNRAPLGSAIFGSAFVTCPWNNASSEYNPDDSLNGNRYLQSLLDQLGPIMSFDPPLNEPDSLNSVATLIRRNTSDDHVLNIDVMPGEEFQVQLGAFDNIIHPVPLTVFSQLSQTEGSRSDESHAEIGATDRYLLEGASTFTDVPIRVFGNSNAAFNVTIASNEASARIEIPVFLKECVTGFRFDNATHKCVCDIVVDNVRCLNNGSIEYPVNAWIGRDENNAYILHNCILNYCQQDFTIVNLDDPDSQCQNNRSGILCGQCISNYSRVFGSAACKDCSNNYLFLILVFAVLGILLVTIIAALNITITDGYINGFIFYGHIMSVYIYNFVPFAYLSNTVLTVAIGFMNLDFGIETCFYNGMEALDRVGLELVFPVYLAGILLTITILAKYGKLKNILCKVNFTRVFATLLLLSYSSVVRTCIDILGFIETSNSEGISTRRWRTDPNVEYFESYHVLLFVISVLFLIILIPFPLLLLLPRLTVRLPYIKKLKPLIDAFCGPLSDHGHFWVGFRLLIRLLIFFIAYLGEGTFQLLLISVFLLLTVILQAFIKPFATLARNLVDLSLMVNLVILSVVAVYLQPQNLEENETNDDVTVAFISVFIIELLLLMIYYILYAIPASRNFCERVVQMLKTKGTALLKKIKGMRIGRNSSEEEIAPTGKKHSWLPKPVHRNRNDPTHMSVYIADNDDFESTEFIGFREAVLEQTHII